MSDNYLSTSFAFAVSETEALHLRHAAALLDALSARDDAETLAAWYGCPVSFTALFPATDETPWSGFLALFPDPDYPHLGAELEVAADRAHIYGDQFDPDVAANLLEAIVTESFPVICTWAATCSKLRLDEFTGGGFRIDATGVHHVSASQLLDTNRCEPRFVLAATGLPDGPLFWNTAGGFGELAGATTFGQAETEHFAAPEAATATRWLQLPAS